MTFRIQALCSTPTDPPRALLSDAARRTIPFRERVGLRAALALFALFAWVGCADQPRSIADIEAMQAAGQMEASLDPLRDKLRADPEDPQLQFLYGRALWTTNRPGLAIWALTGAMRDTKFEVPAGKLLVNTLIMSEAWSDAEAICDDLLEGDLDDMTRSAILTLRSYSRQGSRQNYEGAIEDADRALDLDPDNREVLIPRTVALLELKRVEEAGEALKQLDELHREESSGLTGSGKFCTAGAMFALEKREMELARERFERCLEEFPAHGLLLSKALEFFDRNQEFERSVEILERALEENPNAPPIRENLATRLVAADRREDALSVLRDATQQESVVAQVQAWAMLASFHASTGDIDEAITAYEEARSRLTTASPDLDFRYADILVQSGRLKEALAFAEQLTVSSHRLLIRGRALLALDRPSEALAELSEANRLWPNNAVARYYTAIAAEQTHELDRAIEEYRYSVRIDSSATDAPLRLANYYVALGEHSSAVNTLSLGKETHPNALEMQLGVARIMAFRGAWRELPKRLAATMTTPAYRTRTAVAMADGIRQREGTPAALRFLERVENLNLADAQNRSALKRLVEWLPEVNRAEQALELATKARDATPDDASTQALYAAALAGTGADPEKILLAFEKALEMNASEVVALHGLAEFLAAEINRGEDTTERAAELYRQAIALEPQDDQSSRGLAALLKSEGRKTDVVDVLEDLLARRPWDPDASLLLAGALLDAEAPSAQERGRTRLEWARRLAKFPGANRQLFEEIGQRLGKEATKP